MCRKAQTQMLAWRYWVLAPIIPGPGTNYSGPWRQLYRALAPIMPDPGTNYTGPQEVALEFVILVF